MQLFVTKLVAMDDIPPEPDPAAADGRADAVDDDTDDEDNTPLPASAFDPVAATDDLNTLRGLTFSEAQVTKLITDELAAQNIQEPGLVTRNFVRDPNAAILKPFYRYGFAPPVVPQLVMNIDQKKAGPDNKLMGTLFTLNSAFSDSAIKQALINVVVKLNAQFSGPFYRVQDNGQDLKSAPPTADGTHVPAGLPLFQKMRHLDLLDMSAIAQSQSPADAELKLAPSPGCDFPNCVAFDIAHRWIWIPVAPPLLLVEVGEASKLFTQTANGWTGELVKVNRTAVYRYDLPTGQMVGAQPKLPGSSRGGGGGEARADKSDEADYLWRCDNMIFAAAMGLDPARRYKFSIQPQGFELVPTRLPGFSYWKKWKTDAATVQNKKNRPTDTLPQPSISNGGGDLFAGAAQISSKNTLLAKYKAYTLLRKKKKGDWSVANLGSPSGVPLKARSKGERLDAGDVMKAAFTALGYESDGSATHLVRDVLNEAGDKHDPFASTAWQIFSEGLRARPTVLVATWLPQLRTDQEWCHLYGHGDGGNEALENFVSGSKHANTEQLAIENAQRTRPDDLVAKITAYQLPTQGVSRSQFTAADKAALKAVGWPETDWPDFLTFATKIIQSLRSGADVFYAGLPQPVRDALTRTGKSRQSFYEEIRAMVSLPLPIGLGIRYKIYLKNAASGAGQTIKVFDHLIEAQRESFDIFQYRALYWAVLFSINYSDGGPGGAAAKAVEKRLTDAAEKKLTKNGWTWADYGCSPPVVAK
ncbi:hypothetical protein ASD38_10780 [Caulobacter sp. Root487D2Y]|uniref:hypothetical protein n=1 Tax=Caulobacter sp. Root487D2Y TaxID=1736547 RepID=UPI000701B936|nr:hypothetical protein [Caulobacter sp. Root487D2Y]KQY29799.1 hypothetical protein ASD38_10780 [Caulobacter sp. Root487D2Y]